MKFTKLLTKRMEKMVRKRNDNKYKSLFKFMINIFKIISIL